MKCHHIQELLTPYLDRQLTGQQMLEIQRHLSHCTSCSREYQALREVKYLLRSLAPTSPDSEFIHTIALGAARGRHASFRNIPPVLTTPLRGRRLATALAISCLIVLAVAAPFAPSTVDGGPAPLVAQSSFGAPVFQEPLPQSRPFTTLTNSPLLTPTQPRKTLPGEAPRFPQNVAWENAFAGPNSGSALAGAFDPLRGDTRRGSARQRATLTAFPAR